MAVLGGLVLIVLAALLALGTWQVFRLSWKLDLIARVDQRIHAEPVPPPSADRWAGIGRDADEYRRLRVSGTFLHGAEALVQATTAQGPGFWVMTPLRTPSGETFLINRGFVPSDRRDPATRSEGQVQGEVVVTGLLRLTEPGGGYLRENDAAADRWYSREVAAIFAARGLQQPPPFFIDADATPNPGGLPRGGLTVVRFTNNHLVYAATWYGLALLLAGAAIWIVRDERRRWLAARQSG
ncbi:SURF1 family protein [Terrihabitans rhizophilus]|uniref:SURF1 family protein n=1 Tax=Terrihabitans rhizophilus TaxID=3092662 RepID=UPI003CC51788